MSGARTLRQVLNDPLGEPVPDEFLVILSGLSDDEAGSGGASSGRLTQPESDISALTAETVSLSVHRSSASHNDHRGRAAPSPAKLSTRSASDGSDA
jgi:hypothetical protein